MSQEHEDADDMDDYRDRIDKIIEEDRELLDRLAD
jgi:hypothetical protein